MISEYLKQSVAARNIGDIRGALKGIIDSDPAFLCGDGKKCEFDLAVDYAKAAGIPEDELFEPYSEEFVMEENPAKWSRDYYFQALTCLSHNFSRERVNHLKRVGKAVMSTDGVYRAKKSTVPHTALPEAEPETRGERQEEKKNRVEEPEKTGRASRGDSSKTGRASGLMPMAVLLVVILLLLLILMLRKCF